MATTDFDFQSTRTDIISRALRICGALSTGESLSAEMEDQGIQALNDMVKSWQSDHVFLWTEYTKTLSLVASTQAYSLPTDPYIFAIDKAFFRLNSTDYPIEVISYRKFQDISLKSNEAVQPSEVAVTWDRDSGLYKAYFWPVPNDSGTVLYTGLCRLKDWDTSSSTGDFQPHWTEALTYGLASRLSDEMGLPIREREYLRGQADDALTRAKRGDKAIDDDDFVDGAYCYDG